MAAGFQRLFYLDAARSVLMVLIVAMHACAVYALGNDWIVVSPQTSLAVRHLGALLDLFVLPGFFLISGVLTMAGAIRHGRSVLTARRLRRLLVPLAATAFFLNVPFCLMLRHLGLSETPVLSGAFWLEGGWILHLWFLINLVFYTLIAVPAGALLLALRERAERLVSALPREAVLLALLVAFVGAQLALVAAAWLAPVLYEKVFFNSSLYTFGYYLVFFLLGLGVRAVPSLWRLFNEPAPAIYLQAVPLLLAGNALAQSGAEVPVIGDLTGFFLSFCLVQFLLSRFSGWFDRPAALWGRLSESSYTVYLVHHHVVVLTALALVPVEWPLALEFTILLAVGLAAGLAVHVGLVARLPLLSLLFNGREQHAGQPSATGSGMAPDTEHCEPGGVCIAAPRLLR